MESVAGTAPARSPHRYRDLSRLKACFQCEVVVEERRVKAYLLDVSLRGALVSSRERLPVDSNVSLYVKLPNSDRTLALHGFIVRAARDASDYMREVFHYGVRFNDARSDLMALLNLLMPGRSFS